MGGRESPFPFLRLPGGGVVTIVAQTWPPVTPALASWRQPLPPRPQLSPRLKAYYSPRTFSYNLCSPKQGGRTLHGTNTGFPTRSVEKWRREVGGGDMSVGDLGRTLI